MDYACTYINKNGTRRSDRNGSPSLALMVPVASAVCLKSADRNFQCSRTFGRCTTLAMGQSKHTSLEFVKGSTGGNSVATNNQLWGMLDRTIRLTSVNN
jgi:hypothetical protein